MFLLIDNYDSFTYNLYHYLVELGAKVEVWRNDALSVDDILRRDLSGVILSPGPGTPDDAGISMDLVARAAGRLPIFGVCLGHQVIGAAFGGKVVRAPAPMHGKVSEIHHRATGVFAGLPDGFRATRYHSLLVERESLPPCLSITAETADGLIMGLAHREYLIEGVQFHPESIESEFGHKLLENFIMNAERARVAHVAL